MNPLKRPTADETQEDLLRQQEEFLAKGARPAAIVIQKGDKRKADVDPKAERTFKYAAVKKDVVKLEGIPSLATGDPPSIIKKSSRFKTSQKTESGLQGQRVTFNLEDNEDPEEVMDRHDTHITTVLSKIMEHETRNVPVYIPGGSRQGFPAVPHRGDLISQKEGSDKLPASNKKKKKSLFAQQFQSSSPSSFGLMEGSWMQRQSAKMLDKGTEQMDTSPLMAHGVQDTSRLVIGSGLSSEDDKDIAKAIHEENTAKLSNMSEEEILQEQAKIKAMLDPSLLEFLQKRKSAPRTTGEVDVNKETNIDKEVESMETNETDDVVETDKTDADDEVVQVPVKVSKEWVHMDKIETDKLKWMKDLPKPSAEDSEGAQARFDFSGRLVAKETNIPVREGLHHHGEEQEVPGYSLEELFTLARSSVLNQRVLALQTLSRVIYNSRLLELGGELSEPLLPKLIEAGVVFLLRWSLDDSNEGVMTAAVEGLAALLIQPGDEDTLDKVYTWYHGNSVPPFVPLTVDEEDGEPIKEEDLSDPQMVERDVVKALFRMNTLRRLSYILEKIHPPAPTVLNILSLLIRIARHSSLASHEISKCPKLLEVIVKEFLPMSGWKEQGTQVTDVYGHPVVSAIKLLRVLCASGRNKAASLISQFNLQSLLLRYISVEPTDMSLDIGGAFYLSTEAVRLWHTCIEYGLLSSMYSELYPILAQHLQLFQRLSALPLPSTTSPADETAYRLQLQWSATSILLLEGVVQLAGTAASFQHQSETLVPPAVEWSHVTGLLTPICLCVRRWLGEMTQSSEVISPSSFALGASALNFLASYYQNLSKQPLYSPVDCLAQLEELTNQVLVPFMTSHPFHSVMLNLKNHSSINLNKSHEIPVISALPDLACHHDNQKLMHPCIQKDSNYSFAVGLFCLVYVIVSTHQGLAVKFLPIVESSYVIEYLERFCKRKGNLWKGLRALFSRFEHLALYFLVKIYQITVKHCEASRHKMTLYHRTSLELFTRFQVADYYYAHDVLLTLLFDPEFLWEGKTGDPIATELSERLKVSDSKSRSSTVGSIKGQLLHEAYQHIPSIRHLYMLYFVTNKKNFGIARAEAIHLPHLRKSHLLFEMHEQLIPEDWIFLPLLQLFTEQQKAEMLGKTVKSIPADIVQAMTDALRWIYLLETWRPEVFQSVELAARIARLYCVFLTSSDLFMEPTIKAYLHMLLKIYIEPENLKNIRFDISIPGVSSFYDLYMEVLSQYEAVSFGDHIFANYTLLPLQQRYSPRIKQAVWGEKTEVLHALNLPIQECVLPVEVFLTPPETDLEVLQAYLSALASGGVIQQRAPLMYLIAIHHLNSFMFGTGKKVTDQTKRIKIATAKHLRMAQASPSHKQTWKHHVLFYKSVQLSSNLGFDMFEELPIDRSTRLDEIIPP
ncbi:RNA polymerase II-associated protein 1 [Holothuria leucospilota]|uniref:RNA polymerase II-associated protein 1 n=1 Tax=Holothuria leucospilota TaxID=206669 RepID=A0A9Q1HI18_HOLLE|nr:RNA polymerase II-associated protein 1 [Holothuria leucospilota]